MSGCRSFVRGVKDSGEEETKAEFGDTRRSAMCFVSVACLREIRPEILMPKISMLTSTHIWKYILPPSNCTPNSQDRQRGAKGVHTIYHGSSLSKAPARSPSYLWFRMKLHASIGYVHDSCRREMHQGGSWIGLSTYQSSRNGEG